jgi:2-dehydro-3-deoxygluconokinase
MKKVVSFGETMMRLNPQGFLKLLQAHSLEVSFAGAESNVAVSLANFGCHAVFVTKLPEHDMGQICVNDLRRLGVDTSHILRGGERIGIDFLEKGASQRGSKVIYDRKHSAVAEALPEEYDWKEIFRDADWFHFTGITPALSDNCAKACLQACQTAKQMGLTVSCDLNFRKKLWSSSKAEEVMSPLMKYVDVCICNEEDAADVFGISAEGSDIEQGRLSHEGYRKVAERLTEKFGFKAVAITLRQSISASENVWSGMYYTDGEAYFSREYLIKIVDRVGGGDSFGAGLIYGTLEGFDPQHRLEFAVAASCLKQTIEFDYNLSTVSEVEDLVRGSGSGRIKR